MRYNTVSNIQLYPSQALGCMPGLAMCSLKYFVTPLMICQTGSDQALADALAPPHTNHLAMIAVLGTGTVPRFQ